MNKILFSILHPTRLRDLVWNLLVWAIVWVVGVGGTESGISRIFPQTSDFFAYNDTIGFIHGTIVLLLFIWLVGFYLYSTFIKAK